MIATAPQMMRYGSNCIHPAGKHGRFHSEPLKKGLDVRDRITEGIEAGRPRRKAARFNESPMRRKPHAHKRKNSTKA